MDPRSIKPGLRAAHSGTGIFHPSRVHPHTGEPLEAVGVGKDGDVWWPILGASEDDNAGDGDDADSDDSDDDDDADGDDDDSDDDGDSDDDEKDPQVKIKALEEEKVRHFKRRKKAEKELAKALAEIAKLKKKSKGTKTSDDSKGKKAKPADDADDDDDADEGNAELERERATNAAERRNLQIENAFLRVNTLEWHNPSQVMTLMLADDDYEVEFDDDGKIDRKSLIAELKRFAKANPHLVKKAAKSQGDGSDDKDGKDSKSGSSMNGKRKGKGGKEPTRDELAKKFPALGRR